MKPLVLLSNDDGFDAPGLQALREGLSVRFDVVVCAPRTNQSAVSHALTLGRSLRLHRVDERCFAIDGTPADCVYTALHAGQRILPRRPDLVLSGINRGANLGRDVTYSGTVAAAREAAQRGIPSLAVSAHPKANLKAAASLAAEVARIMFDTHPSQSPPHLLLNLNIPRGDHWPVRVTRLGKRGYTDEVVFREDPRGAPYFWIGGSNVQHESDPQTDTGAWDEGTASLTPLSLKLDAPMMPEHLHGALGELPRSPTND